MARLTKSNARDEGCRSLRRNAMRSCSGLDSRLPVPLTCGQQVFSVCFFSRNTCKKLTAAA